MKQLLLLITSCSCLWGITGSEALTRLQKGNERYVNGALEHPNRSQERREATGSSQEPFAIILGCADSRVAPEILFDQGIGDLFIVRVAGNCLGPLEKESILYGVLALKCSLIVVLGHDHCGAVSAVLKNQAKGFPMLVQHIAPAIKKATSVEEAIQQNVLYVQKEIEKIFPDVKVVGGIYDLSTGKVTLL